MSARAMCSAPPPGRVELSSRALAHGAHASHAPPPMLFTCFWFGDAPRGVRFAERRRPLARLQAVRPRVWSVEASGLSRQLWRAATKRPGVACAGRGAGSGCGEPSAEDDAEVDESFTAENAGRSDSPSGPAPPCAPVLHHPPPSTWARAARTLVSLCSQGTLCTLGASGTPLGMHAPMVLDAEGQPLLRLATGGHSAEALAARPRASLCVGLETGPGRALGRLSLLGAAEALEGEALEAARAAHEELASAARAGLEGAWAGDDDWRDAQLWGRGEGADENERGGGGGVWEKDASLTHSSPVHQRQTHLYVRLRVAQVLYVGGGAAAPSASTALTGDEYARAPPDALRHGAVDLVRFFNRHRADDVALIAGRALGPGLARPEAVWVDESGIVVQGLADAGVVAARQEFRRPARCERDARAEVSMAAQEAWESQRVYVPMLGK